MSSRLLRQFELYSASIIVCQGASQVIFDDVKRHFPKPREFPN